MHFVKTYEEEEESGHGHCQEMSVEYEERGVHHTRSQHQLLMYVKLT